MKHGVQRLTHYSPAECYKNADAIMSRPLSKNKCDIIEFSMVLRGFEPAATKIVYLPFSSNSRFLHKPEAETTTRWRCVAEVI
jgi:hypothetical protein